jgi:predicted ATPase
LVALAEKFGLPIYGWYGRYLSGWAKTQGPTFSEGLALMEEAFARVVSDVSYKIYCGLLAEARFDAGHARDAIALGGLRARQQQV